MLKRTFQVIGGVGVILGLIISCFTIYDRFLKQPDYPIYTKKVLITYLNENDKAFLDFLSENNYKIIYLDSIFESSLSIEENWKVKENCNVDLDSISSGNIDGLFLPYPLDEIDVEWGCSNKISIQFLNKDPIPVTVQSMGIIMFKLKGFFEVQLNSPSNHRFTYTLREIEVPLSVREAITKKVKGEKIVDFNRYP